MTAKPTPPPQTYAAPLDWSARGHAPADLGHRDEGRREIKQVLLRGRFSYAPGAHARLSQLVASSETLRSRALVERGELLLGGPPAELDAASWAACYQRVRDIASLCAKGRAIVTSRGDFEARIHATG